MSKIHQKVGYVRVSSALQSTDRQLHGIKLDKIFEEKVSAKDIHRPELKRMIDHMREGDTLVVHSMDRLARNLDDLRSIVKNLTSKNVAVQFVKENLTFTGEDSTMSNLLLSIMGAFAEFERSLIKERQKEGIALAKEKGLYKGRKPALSETQIKSLIQRSKIIKSKTSLAKEFGVSRQTVYKYCESGVA